MMNEGNQIALGYDISKIALGSPISVDTVSTLSSLILSKTNLPTIN